jgi:hypothetical protein
MLTPTPALLADLPPVGTHCDLVSDELDGRATYLLIYVAGHGSLRWFAPRWRVEAVDGQAPS